MIKKLEDLQVGDEFSLISGVKYCKSVGAKNDQETFIASDKHLENEYKVIKVTDRSVCVSDLNSRKKISIRLIKRKVYIDKPTYYYNSTVKLI